jgi:glycosyltransferase involved in cell wall biosynthesis
VQEEWRPIAGEHVHLIPYAINAREVLPARDQARARLGLPPEERILLFFGTHRLEKDYQTALQGCLKLPHPPLALFVGKVISANDPALVVARCGYPRARVVDEFVSDEMAQLYFAAADAVALPYNAGFSRGSGVLIECCRHLRPMVASATPYFSAFIQQYGCGATFSPGDSASFAQAAEALLARPEVYQPALERARQAHSWDVVVQRYLQLYAADLGSTPRGSAK